MRPVAGPGLIVAALAQTSGAVVAETLTCSRWLDITTCQSPSGYASHESTWQASPPATTT
jgi:hypothetical protein